MAKGPEIPVGSAYLTCALAAQEFGCDLVAENRLQHWTVNGSVMGAIVRLPAWQLEGTVQNESIAWPNGATWVRGG